MNDSEQHPGDSVSKARCRLILVGVQVTKLLSGPDGFGGQIDIVHQYRDYDSWASGERDETADLIVMECPTLFSETVNLIDERVAASNAKRAIVVYHFAQTSAVEMIGKRSKFITALRAPVTAENLKSACETDLALAMIRSRSLGYTIDQDPLSSDMEAPLRGEMPTRQFTDAQLSRLSKISTDVQCECPHHLASILAELNAFERYCSECENKNQADATLHAFLHRRTAQARSMMEDALTILAEAAGLEVSA